MLGRVVSGILAGLITGALGSFVVAIGGAGGDPESSGQAGAIAFFLIWGASIVMAVMAPSAAKAWRRLMLSSSVLSFSMPLASFAFSGSQVAEAIASGGEHSGAAAAGAALGGGIVTAISGFVGFFLGVIFLVIGLLVGRDKQVVVIKEPVAT